MLDALEQALYARRHERESALVHHSDRGSQYVSIRYSERLSQAGIEPSVGSTGDSYDTQLEDASNELGTLARLTLQRAQSQWRELDEHLAWCDERIAAHAKGNDAVKAAATLLGIGPVTASAVVATVGDFKQSRTAPSSEPGSG